MIGADFPILPDSLIEITLPDDLTLVDHAAATTNSTTDGVADLSSAFFVQEIEHGQQVVVKNAFVKSSTPNRVDWRQDSFSVTIAGIQSPRSTAPTLSFKARIIT
jgi:hypothetical protein